ncbi:OmpA family protein [Thermonema rossianum]|uniref:OmpA family protein n=1 Tax=Thermonema rossianum TaxID=55505 RepID=UPI00146FA3FF|nr:OmpA family protein [Thermonema rossianum]
MSMKSHAQVLEDTSPVIPDLGISTFSTEFIIQDKELGSPVEARVEVRDVLASQTIASQKATGGRLSLDLPVKKLYNIRISEPQFEDTTITIDANRLDTFNLVYRIPLTPKKVEYEINIQDIASGEALDFGVVLTNRNRDEVIELSPEDAQNGRYLVKLREGDEYEIEVKNPNNYLFYARKFVASAAKDLPQAEAKPKLDVKMTGLKVGAKIPLSNITFEYNSWELNEDAKREIDRIYKLLKENPTVIVEIAGHTDDRGSAAYNLELSRKRANAVKEYLLQKGMSPDRFVTKGYGESQPIADNKTEEGRAKNRRFELIVLSM